MKIYNGRRTPGGCVVTVNGQPLPTEFNLWRSAADRFEWGYGGTGPNFLAFAILADHFGDEFRALKEYKDFRDQTIALLSDDEWSIESDFIDRSLGETVNVAMTLEQLMNKVRGR